MRYITNQGIIKEMTTKRITKEEKQEMMNYWNSKKIVVHKIMSGETSLKLASVIRSYGADYLKELIDLYATILEVGVDEEDKKYFWTHKWNLYEFLMRGVKKFDGKSPEDYLRKQKVGVTIKRNN